MKIATALRAPALGFEDAAELVFYNGYFMPGLSRLPRPEDARVYALGSLASLPQGAAAGELRRAIVQALAPFAAALGAERFARGSWFNAVNASLAQDAIIVEFASGARPRAPISVACISCGDSASGEWVVSAPRIFARFAPNSEGALVERHATIGEAPCLSIPSTEIVVEGGARAAYARVQAESRASAHFGSAAAALGRDARLEALQIAVGGRVARQELSIRLAGRGAEAIADGLSLAQGQQHFDHFSSIEHVVGETSSRQLYKGIVADESRLAFRGRMRIEAGAQKSSADQLCQNLSLSKKAEVDARPELEIFADDVKASHGATIGQLDAEQIFYFQARAIDRVEAARALARGFARDVLDRVGDGGVRRLALADVEAKLGGLLDGSLGVLTGRAALAAAPGAGPGKGGAA
jgi:Fe-S cluster assembly protein SufD